MRTKLGNLIRTFEFLILNFELILAAADEMNHFYFV